MSNSAVIRNNSLSSFSDPCYSYLLLNSTHRSQFYVTYSSGGRAMCDNHLVNSWYRFSGAAGTQMPESCVPTYRCGTLASGWLNGNHPNVSEGIVTRTVCFHWSSRCCAVPTNIDVKNCGGYYVYNLKPTGCYFRYCGIGQGGIFVFVLETNRSQMFTECLAFDFQWVQGILKLLATLYCTKSVIKCFTLK